MPPSPFPCELERVAASALLLLSNKPQSPSVREEPPSFLSLYRESKSEKSERSEKSKESLILSNPNSCSSSLTSESSSEELLEHRRRIIAVVERCHEIKLKVVKKSRTKTYWSSECRKMTSDIPATEGSECIPESTEGSCLSSGSSGNSSARSCCEAGGRRKGVALAHAEPKRKPLASGHMRRRAEAILKLLSGGCASEIMIRQLLGDSPDTSKALRMLLKLEEVERSGAGGRGDPYVYKIA